MEQLLHRSPTLSPQPTLFMPCTGCVFWYLGGDALGASFGRGFLIRDGVGRLLLVGA